MHYALYKQQLRVVVWRSDTEGRCSTFTVSLFHESDEQIAERHRKYEGFWFSLLSKCS